MNSAVDRSGWAGYSTTRLLAIAFRTTARGIPVSNVTNLFAILAIAGTLAACNSGSPSPELANGWVTNCRGPQFSKFSRDGSVGPGPARPVFKIANQFVLAVPAGNWPSTERIERVPRACRSLSDLPEIPYLYFVIRGNWSGSYNPKDIPLDGGRKQFLPDVVTVRIERETLGTSSIEDQSRIASVKAFYDNLLSKQEIGGLTCGRNRIASDPNLKGGLFCSGHRTPADPDTIAFKTFSYDTPFVLIDANYASTRYGGIHVYWSVWTVDVAQGRDIDQAVWKSLTEWNLIEGNDASSPR
jgi:hypothetical protein